ncbi:MAG: iron-regulated protein [Verrucomicrobiales bacterium]|nr:iron-regulated protein [Verrucomicrobiales bacterium]
MKPAFLFLLLFAAAPALADAEPADWKLTCSAVAENYANIAFATYSDSLKEAKKLDETVGVFLQSPSAQSLKAVKQQWIRARQPYLQTEVFRFYGGPIDGADGPETFLNGWPLDENYIEAILEDEANFPEITPDLLMRMNEKGGETLISTGWHAIEFLLWGPDESETGPGNRPVSDFTTAGLADRRGRYLQTCSELLVKHLESLGAEWKPGSKKNYRADFLDDENIGNSVRNLLYGVKTMAGVELGGERLLVPWDTQFQEDEHSCFSDTTPQDMLFDAKGIENLFFGKYARLDGRPIEGPGLRKLAAASDPELAALLEKNIAAMMAAVKAIPRPFDQAILGERDSAERRKILRCVEILEDQADLWTRLERAVAGKAGR